MSTSSYATRLRRFATDRPKDPALTIVGGDQRTWAELVADAEHVAKQLVTAGVTTGDMVTIAHPNGVPFIASMLACWLVGAVPQPVSSKLPGRELHEIVELADSKVVVGVTADHVPDRAVLEPDHLDQPAPDVELPADAVSPSWKAPTSGGSTGRPKLIVAGNDSTMPDDAPTSLGFPGGCMVMPGPMYHNGPFMWSSETLLHGGHLVLLTRFDPELTLASIEQFGGDTVYLVPTMMQRIWRLDPEVRERYDLSSLRRVWHLAAPCPAWLKEEWIRWLGPEKIIELYGGTEGQSATVITGVEWLEHKGSVGRPTRGEIKIVREDGTDAAPGEHGEVYMRPDQGEVTYRYVGAEASAIDGGWETLGDMGWMDEDGYLYLGDRKKDMILSGGSNIYPAEVEAAIERHPQVVSCAVIGVPDEDLGQVVHAVVQAEPDPGGRQLDSHALQVFLADELVRYKIPRSFEFVDEPVRDEAGKVRRSTLGPRA